jgi:hypothetical protein
MTWAHSIQNFTAVHADVLTQHHMNNSGGALPTDYDMYLPYRLLPNQVGFVKVYKDDRTEEDLKPAED